MGGGQGAYNWNEIFVYKIEGPITKEAYKRSGGVGGFKTGILWQVFLSQTIGLIFNYIVLQLTRNNIICTPISLTGYITSNFNDIQSEVLNNHA